jgi:hypothetical protein
MRSNTCFALLLIVFGWATSFYSSVVHAQSQTALSPDALGAKTVLEDFLVRRYSQILATRLERSYFTMGAELDLIAVLEKKDPPPEPSQESEPISDLDVGMLDPEVLLKKMSVTGQQRDLAIKFLQGFKIKTVVVNVGLSDKLDAETRTEIEKWLSEKLKQEFGTSGKGVVSTIKIPAVPEAPKAEEKPKTPLDLLENFQELAGQIALALAIVVAVILGSLFANKRASQALSAQAASGGKEAAAAPQAAVGSAAMSEAEKQRLAEEKEEREMALARAGLESLKPQIVEVLPKVLPQLEPIMRSWGQTGEVGFRKMALFSEIAGRDLGKLPVPIDLLPEVTKTFAKMAEVGPREKFDLIKKIQWDLLTVINIGPAALEQPFGYLGSLNTGLLSQALMEENSKIRTVVSLFMPTDLRTRFLKPMSLDQKKELLQIAANMSEIPSADLKTYERGLQSKLKPQSREDVVALDLTIHKLVEALDPVEQLLALPGLEGPSVLEYKRTVPSLAFIAEWTDEALAALLAQTSSDEFLTLCRVRADLKDKLFALAPKMTVAMVSDEMDKPDKLSNKEKALWLSSLQKKLSSLVLAKVINLEEMFPETNQEQGSLPTTKAA